MARLASSSDADTEAYAYDLPRHLIAEHPLPERDASRLLVLRRDERESESASEDRSFRDFLEYLDPGDALVVNDSRVFPARLVGRKPTGASAEILLLRPIDSEAYRWEAWVRPGQKLKPGRVVEVAEGLSVRIEASREGGREVRLETSEDPWAAIERHGLVPLPPYIRRESTEADRERYQTVYAAQRGSVAAPTAGLHLTEALLERVRRRGVHRLEAERHAVSPESADTLNEVRAEGGRVVAVGTTVVRVLEATVREDGFFEAGSGETDLFIHPPFRFRAVDRLLTNFHLPRSTLLMLVAAFAGRERVLRAYRHAVIERYRFYSYGDAMLVL
jgi:S-adenosylmethionine:tRNA ribosyltransferase-isomerase